MNSFKGESARQIIVPNEGGTPARPTAPHPPRMHASYMPRVGTDTGRIDKQQVAHLIGRQEIVAC